MVCTSTPCAGVHLAIYPSYVSADKGQEADSAESWLQIRGSPVSCASILGHLVLQRLRSAQAASGTSPIPSLLVTPYAKRVTRQCILLKLHRKIQEKNIEVQLKMSGVNRGTSSVLATFFLLWLNTMTRAKKKSVELELQIWMVSAHDGDDNCFCWFKPFCGGEVEICVMTERAWILKLQAVGRANLKWYELWNLKPSASDKILLWIHNSSSLRLPLSDVIYFLFHFSTY